MMIVSDLKILRQKSQDVTPEEVPTIVQMLELALQTSKRKGLGLAAIQIGIAKRVAIVRMSSLSLDLVNPIIEDKSEPFRFKQEGCLSVVCDVDTRRYREIVLNNNGRRAALTGLEACVVQHEIDHLNGLTILDRKWRAR